MKSKVFYWIFNQGLFTYLPFIKYEVVELKYLELFTIPSLALKLFLKYVKMYY